MMEFETFRSSIRNIWPDAKNLQKKNPDDLTKDDWENLEKIFRQIKCMNSGTSIVGNSKVMAHLVPELIPPVDRAYTLKFLYNRTQVKNNMDLEWKLLSETLTEFFYPVIRLPAFLKSADKWLVQKEFSNWDTSKLKLVDNLVIGLSKIKK